MQKPTIAMLRSGVGPKVARLPDLARGLRQSPDQGVRSLQAHERSKAVGAIDAAFRSAQVGAAVPGSAFTGARDQIRQARRALQLGRPAEAIRRLRSAAQLAASAESASASPGRPCGDAVAIDANGTKIGELSQRESGELQLRGGGLQKMWGFVAAPSAPRSRRSLSSRNGARHDAPPKRAAMWS